MNGCGTVVKLKIIINNKTSTSSFFKQFIYKIRNKSFHIQRNIILTKLQFYNFLTPTHSTTPTWSMRAMMLRRGGVPLPSFCSRVSSQLAVLSASGSGYVFNWSRPKQRRHQLSASLAWGWIRQAEPKWSFILNG